MRRFLLLPALLLLGFALACGGGGGGRTVPTGTLTLRLGTDSFPGYDQVVVSLERVEATRDGSTWFSLGDVKATFDLMTLQNGHGAVVLPTTQFDLGTFSQLRLVWAARNYQDQTRQPAFITPSGALTGLILNMPPSTVVKGPITISDGTDTLAQVMLSGQQAVMQRAGVQPYWFTATGQVFDLSACATLAGVLTHASNPIAGAEVFAESVDGVGKATLLRRAFTDATGSYTLEALPAGSTYFIVSQPPAGPLAYDAVASAPINASTPATFHANLAFAAPSAPGDLLLTIVPASTAAQSTWGELRQAVATGGAGTQFLIIRSEGAAAGVAQDQVGFVGMTQGLYGVTSQRSTSGATPVMNVGTSVTVIPGSTASTTLNY